VHMVQNSFHRFKVVGSNNGDRYNQINHYRPEKL
jgi:hypothetical protein